MNKKVFNKKNLIKLIFNIVETILIFYCGLMIKLNIRDTIFIMLLFMFSKIIFGKSLHYKKWYKCLLCSTTILITLFMVFKFNIWQSIILTLFCSCIMTTKANLKDAIEEINDNMYHWSGKTSKYDPLRDFVGTSPNNPIVLDYEEYWRKNNPIRYEMFIMFYRERKSYEQIKKIKDYDENTIIKNECKSIYEQLEKPLNLPPLKK